MTVTITILAILTVTLLLLYVRESNRNHRLKQELNKMNRDLKKAYERIEDLELNPRVPEK